MADKRKSPIFQTAAEMTDHVISEIDATRDSPQRRADIRSDFIEIVAECLDYFQRFGDPSEHTRNFLEQWHAPKGYKQ